MATIPPLGSLSNLEKQFMDLKYMALMQKYPQIDPITPIQNVWLSDVEFDLRDRVYLRPSDYLDQKAYSVGMKICNPLPPNKDNLFPLLMRYNTTGEACRAWIIRKDRL